MTGEVKIEPGQRWKRKRDGAVVRVTSQAGDPIHEDWNVKCEGGSRRVRRIFEWNLHRLYDLLPADAGE